MVLLLHGLDSLSVLREIGNNLSQVDMLPASLPQTAGPSEYGTLPRYRPVSEQPYIRDPEQS